MAHVEQHAPLARLLGLATAHLVDELQLRLVEAGFGDHRRAHHNVMPHVPEAGIRLTDLADRAGMTKQAMAELVADLERLGYLQRSADRSDRRAKIIEFTARGRAAARVALDSLREIENEITNQIGARSMATLRRSLLSILDHPAR